MIRAFLIVLGGLVVFGAAAGVYLGLGDAGATVRVLTSRWDAPVSQEATPRRFQVQEGQSAAEIGRALEQQQLIRSALLFRALVRLRGVENELGSGEYELRPNMSTSEIIDVLLAGGSAPGRTFAIPEGWRAAEVAQRLEALGYVEADDFLVVVATPARIAPYDQLIGEVPNLKGYLFPDTYEVAPDATAEAIAEMMVRQFDRKFESGLRREASALGMTLQEVVTLASIIEREAAVPEERRLISGVFHNRLKAGMPLQADPTVQYAVASRDLPAALSQGFWKKNLTPEDLATPSPYNTYLVKGLPPGPICNPGLASLAAAVDPEQTDYYYFVARGDGSHEFAKSRQEHELNIRQLDLRQEPPG